MPPLTPLASATGLVLLLVGVSAGAAGNYDDQPIASELGCGGGQT